MAITYCESMTVGPPPARSRQRSTMSMRSTMEEGVEGTLSPIGQFVNWNSWHLFGSAFTPVISSVSEIICGRVGKTPIKAIHFHS